jgi:quinol monooxygenase YgiN
MPQAANVVSIHPYFKVHAGKMDAFKAALPAFIKKVATEPKNIYFDFTISGDVVYCREAYDGADGLLAHVANVGPMLPTLFAMADLTRIEVHGPSAELEKLKGPLADLKPMYFTYFDGVKR